VQALPASLTVQEGQTGVQLSHDSSLWFRQGVQLACSDLPVNVTCSFNKPSVTLDGVHPFAGKEHWNWQPLGRSSQMAVAAFFFVPFGRRKRFKATFIVLALLGLGLAGAGCGGSGSKPNQGIGAAYTIHVTANTGAGSTAKIVAVVVNVTK